MNLFMALSAAEPNPVGGMTGDLVHDEVIGRVVEGSETSESAEAVIQRLWMPMFRFAMLLVSDTQTAEEITQEAFTRWYVHRSSVTHPPAYLRTAIVNLAHGHHRKLRITRRRAHLFNTEARQRVELPQPEMLMDAVNQLPIRQRAVVVLRFYEGCSEAEIAKVVGCRPGTVKSLTSRALETLRRGIER